MTEENRKDEAHKDEQDHNGENPEYENFQETLKQVLSVPKEELDKKRAEEKRQKKEKRAG
ncbi:MAG: hypothetical protein LC781_14165 [Actinobacteria bacterium]|nr:hypothetical protein [Actinomycetota bacterium]